MLLTWGNGGNVEARKLGDLGVELHEERERLRHHTDRAPGSGKNFFREEQAHDA
jgi:hypothetical protein